MRFLNEHALVDYIAKVKAVTNENMMDAANAYLQEDMLSTVILQPTR